VPGQELIWPLTPWQCGSFLETFVLNWTKKTEHDHKWDSQAIVQASYFLSEATLRQLAAVSSVSSTVKTWGRFRSNHQEEKKKNNNSYSPCHSELFPKEPHLSKTGIYFVFSLCSVAISQSLELWCISNDRNNTIRYILFGINSLRIAYIKSLKYQLFGSFEI